MLTRTKVWESLDYSNDPYAEGYLAYLGNNKEAYATKGKSEEDE